MSGIRGLAEKAACDAGILWESGWAFLDVMVASRVTSVLFSRDLHTFHACAASCWQHARIRLKSYPDLSRILSDTAYVLSAVPTTI